MIFLENYLIKVLMQILLLSVAAVVRVCYWHTGLLIVYWPITIKQAKQAKITSKLQTNYHYCLRFSYLAPYWLISGNTITFLKYFLCSRFCEFHSKNSLFLTFNYCRYNIKPFSSGENCEISEDQYLLRFSFIDCFTIVKLRFSEQDY